MRPSNNKTTAENIPVESKLKRFSIKLFGYKATHIGNAIWLDAERYILKETPKANWCDIAASELAQTTKGFANWKV